MDHLATVLKDVVVTGQFQQVFKELLGNSGVLGVMDTDSVHVIDVETGLVLRVVTTIQKQLTLLVVVNILYALLVYIVVVPDSVTDVMDVLPM
tara:strand:- start:64 stop:342 length:279 start_codon:yes stop_codon:yes gene_type:complete